MTIVCGFERREDGFLFRDAYRVALGSFLDRDAGVFAAVGLLQWEAEDQPEEVTQKTVLVGAQYHPANALGCV